MDAVAVRRKHSGSVPAVERAAGMLLALGNGQGEATLTELARHLGIHKSTAHNILDTLARHGFVSRDAATRRYRLGPTLAALGHAAVAGRDLAVLARPYLTRLRRLTGETVTLHARDGAGSVIIASEESPHELKVSAPPGHRLPPTAGAVAKVLLAFGTQVRPRLPDPLPAFTSRTPVSTARYLDELRRVRLAGVGYDDMEYLPGVRAVSAPVFSPGILALAGGSAPVGSPPTARAWPRPGPGAAREAVAVLSIVGVAARISPADLRRFARPLRHAARALSAALHAPADRAPSARLRPIRPNGRGRRSA